ncbi:DUF2842 domain-containing protein [Pacificimonas sp. WHA3]|uniref:DUF2842 domain-containing protein n=1 Tax=Pacificimonas pallii TaxID=2827236 RepID=A0ABS6SE44_9SPHN|nr:DUF2842 domain-containing protein [Pacificimonas pallii]MBV7256654.1 DUF2842 domain-containing protein [Pacificimonas pallii]
MTDETPKLRKPLGVLGIIAFIAIYSGIIMGLADPILTLPILLQLPIWIVLGILWVFPLKPVIVWIETGRFK